VSRPPQARRIDLSRGFSVAMNADSAGAYTVYAVPRKLDPSYRRPPQVLPAVIKHVEVADRPAAQEFRIDL